MEQIYGVVGGDYVEKFDGKWGELLLNAPHGHFAKFAEFFYNPIIILSFIIKT